MGLFTGGCKMGALFICHSDCHVPLWFVPGLWRPQVAKRPPSLLLTRLAASFFFVGIPRLSAASTPHHTHWCPYSQMQEKQAFSEYLSLLSYFTYSLWGHIVVSVQMQNLLNYCAHTICKWCVITWHSVIQFNVLFYFRPTQICIMSIYYKKKLVYILHYFFFYSYIFSFLPFSCFAWM